MWMNLKCFVLCTSAKWQVAPSPDSPAVACVLFPHFEVLSYLAFLLPRGCFSVLKLYFQEQFECKITMSPPKVEKLMKKMIQKEGKK